MAGSFQQFLAKICSKVPVRVLTADKDPQVVTLEPDTDIVVIGFDEPGIGRYKILTAAGVECLCPLKYVKPI